MADWSEASSPRSVITSWSCGKRTMEVETSGGGTETRQYTVCQRTTVLHPITALVTHTLQARPFPKPFSYSHGLRTELQLFSFASHSQELQKVIKLWLKINFRTFHLQLHATITVFTPTVTSHWLVSVTSTVTAHWLVFSHTYSYNSLAGFNHTCHWLDLNHFHNLSQPHTSDWFQSHPTAYNLIQKHRPSATPTQLVLVMPYWLEPEPPSPTPLTMAGSSHTPSAGTWTIKLHMKWLELWQLPQLVHFVNCLFGGFETKMLASQNRSPTIITDTLEWLVLVTPHWLAYTTPHWLLLSHSTGLGPKPPTLPFILTSLELSLKVRSLTFCSLSSSSGESLTTSQNMLGLRSIPGHCLPLMLLNRTSSPRGRMPASWGFPA